METETETMLSPTIPKDGGTGETQRLANIEKFRQAITDQQEMVRFAKGIGKILTQERVVELSESHDIAHVEKHPNSTYAKWKEYFRYFIRDHREPYQKQEHQEATPSYYKKLNQK